MNWRRGVVVLGGLTIVVVIILAVALRSHAKRTDPLAGVKPAIYQPNNSGQTLPLPAPHR